MMSAPRWMVLGVFALASCGESAATPDAARQDATSEEVAPDVKELDAVAPVDAATDRPRDAAVDTGARPLFSECTSGLQCGARGGICILASEGYPGGLCTHTCTDDSTCGDGVCIPYGSAMRCFPRCAAAADCRAGYQCFAVTGADPDARVCLPFCTSDAQCSAAGCNAYSRFCGTPDPMRADNGAPCEASGDCRSNRCSTELGTTMQPTGNLGGICTSRCTVAPDDDYAGARVPRSDCPMGSVCPRDTGAVAGAVGTCRVECTTNEQCRPGFICSHPRRPGADAGTYENGYCAAMNCRFGTQMCPAIAECRTTTTNDAGMPTNGICVRTDAGASDGATDATATDATATDATADVTGDAGPAVDAVVAADATADLAG